MKVSLFVVATAALTACSSIVPATIARLSVVSPLDADPARFAVALDVPDGVGVQDGSALLTLDATRSDTGQSLSGRYVLAPETDPDGGLIYQVAPGDLDNLRGLQARINAWETQDPDATSGSLSVSLTPCQIGSGPAKNAVVSAAIRIEQDGAFLPLVRDVPVAEFLTRSGVSDMPAC